MPKEQVLHTIDTANFGTANTWYKSPTIELLANNGKTPIRIDKMMSQISGYHTGVAPAVLGAVVHLSDETGATFDDAITSGTTDTAALETLLNQWKDYVWMTDFEILGTGQDEVNIHVTELSADTRRLLQPGQSLNCTILALSYAGETSKTMRMLLDAMFWYSPSA